MTSGAALEVHVSTLVPRPSPSSEPWLCPASQASHGYQLRAPEAHPSGDSDPRGSEAEGLGMVQPRSRVTGVELLLLLPFHLLEAVLRSCSISGWAESFGRGKSSKPGPLTGRLLCWLEGAWLWMGMTLCKDILITYPFPDKASAGLPQHPSTPHPQHSLTPPPRSQTPGCSSTQRAS